jgi:hypothetical protein
LIDGEYRPHCAVTPSTNFYCPPTPKDKRKSQASYVCQFPSPRSKGNRQTKQNYAEYYFNKNKIELKHCTCNEEWCAGSLAEFLNYFDEYKPLFTLIAKHDLKGTIWLPTVPLDKKKKKQPAKKKKNAKKVKLKK